MFSVLCIFHCVDSCNYYYIHSTENPSYKEIPFYHPIIVIFLPTSLSSGKSTAPSICKILSFKECYITIIITVLTFFSIYLSASWLELLQYAVWGIQRQNENETQELTSCTVLFQVPRTLNKFAPSFQHFGVFLCLFYVLWYRGFAIGRTERSKSRIWKSTRCFLNKMNILFIVMSILRMHERRAVNSGCIRGLRRLLFLPIFYHGTYITTSKKTELSSFF